MPWPPFIRNSDGSIQQGRVVHPGPDWSLKLEPPDLSFVRVDHEIRLHFESTVVVVATHFELRTVDETHELSPENRAELGPLLDVYPDSLAKASVDADCSLVLDFVSGSRIFVPPDEYYEAWQVQGPGSRLVACLPAGGAGGLSVWQ
jgi:hypothetical protein